MKAPQTTTQQIFDWMIIIAEEDVTDPTFTEESLAESAFVNFGDVSHISDDKMMRLARRAIRIAENNIVLECLLARRKQSRP